MTMAYLVLYVLLAGLFFLSLGLAAKKAMPRFGRTKRRTPVSGLESTYHWMRGGHDVRGVLRAKDLPCLMFESRKCVCRGESQALEKAEPVGKAKPPHQETTTDHG